MENKANCPPIQPGPMAQIYERQGFFGKYDHKPPVPEPNYHKIPGVPGTEREYTQMLERDIKQANIEIGELNFKLNEALEINANLVNVIEQKNNSIHRKINKLANAKESLERSDKLLRRANAEIATLQARVNHGSGADKQKLNELSFIIAEAILRFGMKVKTEHIEALRIAAK